MVKDKVWVSFWVRVRFNVRVMVRDRVGKIKLWVRVRVRFGGV